MPGFIASNGRKSGTRICSSRKSRFQITSKWSEHTCARRQQSHDFYHRVTPHRRRHVFLHFAAVFRLCKEGRKFETIRRRPIFVIRHIRICREASRCATFYCRQPQTANRCGGISTSKKLGIGNQLLHHDSLRSPQLQYHLANPRVFAICIDHPACCARRCAKADGTPGKTGRRRPTHHRKRRQDHCGGGYRGTNQKSYLLPRQTPCHVSETIG